MNLYIENMSQGYIDICSYVLGEGTEVSPRGMKTYEVLGGSFTLLDPTRALPLGVGRNVSLPFAAVEAVQLIGGISAPSLVLRINPTMERFMDWRYHWDPNDDLHILQQHGAYGPRVIGMIPKIIQKLKDDRDSRQAVATIFDPRRDFTETVDVPCTLSLQFFIRNDLLDLSVTMRSNDVWWGTAYDVFQFTQLQQTVANLLGINVGVYRHHANSLHIYERDIPAIEKLHDPDEMSDAELPRGLLPSQRGQGYAGVTFRAQYLVDLALERLNPPVASQLSWSEQWYLDHLRYVSPRASEMPVEQVRRVPRQSISTGRENISKGI